MGRRIGRFVNLALETADSRHRARMGFCERYLELKLLLVSVGLCALVRRLCLSDLLAMRVGLCTQEQGGD